MTECIFCKIRSQEIPAIRVYEDPNTCAFLDIHPVNPGHTLVIPTYHCSSLLDLPNEAAISWIQSIQNVARAMCKGLQIPGFNLELNNGSVAGQVVPHVHMHVIPRLSGDGLRPWSGKEIPAEQMQEIADRIRGGF